MRLRRCFASCGAGLRAGIPFFALWLEVVLVALVATPVVSGSARGLHVSTLCLTPEGMIVDSDIVTATLWTLERAAAGNALMQSVLELTAHWRTATVSLDRYSGAANAGDEHWASEQAAMLI